MTDSGLSEAVRLHRAGDTDAATDLLRILLDAGTTDIRVHEVFANLALQCGARDEAIAALRQAAGLARRDHLLSLRIARGMLAAQVPDDALDLLRDLADSDCAKPEVIALCAAAHRLRGDRAAEIGALTRAIGLAPESLALRTALATVLANDDRLDDAIGTLHTAASIAPDDARVRNNLGALLIRADRPDDAVRALESALRLDGSYAAAAANLAVVLHRLGRLDKARAAAERAIAADDSLLDARVELAAICTAAGDYAAADAALDAVLSDHPAHEGACIALAELRELQGRYQDGFDFVGELAPRATDSVNARLVAASLARRLGHYDTALSLLKPLLDAAGLPLDNLASSQRRRLGFLLGDIHDAAGDLRQALAAYAAGNQAARRSFDAAAHSKRIDQLIETFSSNALAAAPRAGPIDCRPVFIVGLPRSGTSLLETMLSRHHDVHAAGELPIVGEYAAMATASDTDISVATSESLEALAGGWLRASGATRSARAVTDKMPLNFLHIGWIALAFPEARVLHLCRNPQDLLLSCYRQNFLDPALGFSFNFGDLADYWRDYIRLMQHWKRVTTDLVLDVSYETLIAEPEATLRSVFDFIGLGFSPRCLAPQLAERNVATASHAQVREAPHSRSIGRFARYAPYLGTRAAAIASLR